MVEGARTGEEARLGPLGIDARLEGMPRERELVLPHWERVARRREDLPLDEIDTRHHLGDRVLHLQPRVHLHKVELRRVGRIRDELDRAGALVVDLSRGAHRGLAQCLAQFGRDPRRGRLLDHFLVAPLHRAVALEEIDSAAVLVAEDLHLDVARRREVALDEQAVVGEGGERLAPRAVDRASRSSSAVFTMRIPFPPPPSTALRSTGLPSPKPHVRLRSSVSQSCAVPWYPGSSGTPASSISRFAASLDPMSRIDCAGGPMKASPASLATASANSAFSRKPMRVDRLGAGRLRRLQHAVIAQVRVR